MENSQMLNWIAAGTAVVLTIGGFLMMFTTIFTTKSRK